MLQNQITKLQEEIEENIQSLNSGGCIHFAFFFSRRLKTLNIKHKIIYSSTWDDNLNEAAPCSHVLVYIAGIGYIDGEKTYKNKKELYQDYFKYMASFDTDLNLVRKRKGWNVYYNKRQNKKLNYLINKYII